MLARLMDFLKGLNITAMLTSLTSANQSIEATQMNISSLVDTWILLSNVDQDNERKRFIRVMKSRGMASSKSIREFDITNDGVLIQDTAVASERK